MFEAKRSFRGESNRWNLEKVQQTSQCGFCQPGSGYGRLAHVGGDKIDGVLVRLGHGLCQVSEVLQKHEQGLFISRTIVANDQVKDVDHEAHVVIFEQTFNESKGLVKVLKSLVPLAIP